MKTTSAVRMDIAEGEREKKRTVCFRVPLPRARRFIQLHPPSCISGTDRVSMSGTVPADSFVNPPLRRRLLSLRVPHIYGRGERETDLRPDNIGDGGGEFRLLVPRFFRCAHSLLSPAAGGSFVPPLSSSFFFPSPSSCPSSSSTFVPGFLATPRRTASISRCAFCTRAFKLLRLYAVSASSPQRGGGGGRSIYRVMKCKVVVNVKVREMVIEVTDNRLLSPVSVSLCISFRTEETVALRHLVISWDLFFAGIQNRSHRGKLHRWLDVKLALAPCASSRSLRTRRRKRRGFAPDLRFRPFPSTFLRARENHCSVFLRAFP